jgi:hypothetical protein
MSNFLEVALASLTGIVVFYALEAAYYDVKARIRGKQYERFLEDLEEEYQE